MFWDKEIFPTGRDIVSSTTVTWNTHWTTFMQIWAFSHPLVKISLRRRHALMVEDGAFSHKIGYVPFFLIASLGQNLQQFWWTGGFYLVVELHREGIAPWASLRSRLVYRHSKWALLQTVCRNKLIIPSLLGFEVNASVHSIVKGDSLTPPRAGVSRHAAGI